MSALVQVENVSKYYGTLKAVDDLSLKVNRGEIVGFLGPNGAGKSTTIKMITGFLNPQSGRVLIDGEDIADDPVKLKKKMGYLPEGAPAYSDMRVYDFLNFIAEVRGLKKQERLSRIKLIAQKVNIDMVLAQPIETLSKGFKRRVGLAQAILHDPEILILDEPTDGLDPNQKYEMRTLISELAKNKAILISTHILEEVEAVCHRVVVIAGGKMVANATPSELLSSNQQPSIILAISGVDDDQFAIDLGEVIGVERLEILSRTQQFAEIRLFCGHADGPVQAITQMARQKKWKIEGLTTQKGRLDEVFRNITQRIQKMS